MNEILTNPHHYYWGRCSWPDLSLCARAHCGAVSVDACVCWCAKMRRGRGRSQLTNDESLSPPLCTLIPAYSRRCHHTCNMASDHKACSHCLCYFAQALSPEGSERLEGHPVHIVDFPWLRVPSHLENPDRLSETVTPLCGAAGSQGRRRTGRFWSEQEGSRVWNCTPLHFHLAARSPCCWYHLLPSLKTVHAWQHQCKLFHSHACSLTLRYAVSHHGPTRKSMYW